MTDAPILDGRYALVERLGNGGMSVVWQGYDQVLGRPVAVKVMTPGVDAQVPSPDRIRTEAQALARLSHPHIAAVYDYGLSETDSGEHLPYLVMELLSGPTLADRLKTDGPLPIPVALLTCAQVASALAAAHAAGLVHRDVKPSNIMLTPAGVKVLDFGLAANAWLGGAAEVFGTPAYLAPERLTSSQALPASDVFGLGLVWYVALTGRLPWPAETIAEMLAARQYAEPAALPRFLGVPRDAGALLGRCLAHDPHDRPSAAEVATGLAEAVVSRRSGRPWAAAAVIASAPVPAGAPSGDVGEAQLDRRGVAAVAAALVTAVAVVSGVLGVTSEPAPPGGTSPGVVAQEPAPASPTFPEPPPDGVFAPPDDEPAQDDPVPAPVPGEQAPEDARGDSDPVDAEPVASDPGSGGGDEPDSGSTPPADDPEPPAEPPAEPEPEPEVEIPPPDPSPTTLATDAGTLVVQCAGDTVSLVSSDLLPGFSVVESGPARVRVSALLLSVVVTCQGGVPSTAVEVL